MKTSHADVRRRVGNVDHGRPEEAAQATPEIGRLGEALFPDDAEVLDRIQLLLGVLPGTDRDRHRCQEMLDGVGIGRVTIPLHRD